MIEAISVSYLLAIGILLIGLEALIFSFVLFFFGIGFIVVALISQFYLFDNGLVQVAVAFVFALLFAGVFRKNLLQKISQESKEVEERAHVSGFGTVEEGMVKFHGTYWKSVEDISTYEEGSKVEVVDVVDNMVVLKSEVE